MSSSFTVSSMDLAEKMMQARMNKEWLKVETYARRCLAQNPRDIYAIQSIGEAMEKQGLVTEALEFYERALETDKGDKRENGHTFFLKRLDVLYHKAGKYSDCLRVCRFYSARHPQSWDAWNRLRRAAQKTGNDELSITAKGHADQIKAQEMEEESVKKARQARWSELYEDKLREIGYGVKPIRLEQEPPPSYEATDEEWGDWVRRTTDWDQADAEYQAFLFASFEVERQERMKRRGTDTKMTSYQRQELTRQNLIKVIAGECDVLTLSDQTREDNRLQFMDQICIVSLRDYPTSELPPLSENQLAALSALEFMQSSDLDFAGNYCARWRSVDIDEMVEKVQQVFAILGSPDDFVLQIEN